MLASSGDTVHHYWVPHSRTVSVPHTVHCLISSNQSRCASSPCVLNLLKCDMGVGVEKPDKIRRKNAKIPVSYALFFKATERLVVRRYRTQRIFCRLVPLLTSVVVTYSTYVSNLGDTLGKSCFLGQEVLNVLWVGATSCWPCS